MGLWLVPVVISVYMVWWKFVLVGLSVLHTADRLQTDVLACKYNQLQITGCATYTLSIRFINIPYFIVRSCRPDSVFITAHYCNDLLALGNHYKS